MNIQTKQRLWPLLLSGILFVLSSCGFDDDGSPDLVISIEIEDEDGQETNTFQQSQNNPITFKLGIENKGDEDVTLTTTTNVRYDIQIIDETEDDEVIFEWSDSQASNFDTGPLEIKADDSEVFPIEWDQLLLDGGLIDKGTYKVRGFFEGHAEDVETQLTIE